MKKLVLALFGIFMFASANATHLIGGEMYVDKLSAPNSYKVTLLIYRDVVGIGLPSSFNVTTNIPGNTTLVLNEDTSANQSISLSCLYYNVEVKEYSTTFTISSAIPTSGYELNWNSCCRTNAIDNLMNAGSAGFDITTKLFPGVQNTARFLNPSNSAGVSGINQYFNHSAFDPDPQDSIYISLANPKQSSGNIAYNTNYSATQPFGINVPTSLNSNTGILQVGSVSPGVYVVASRVQSYSNGVLTSVVRRDVPFYFDLLGNIPSIALNNLQGANVLSNSNNSYVLEMTENDSLSFDLQGLTTQLTNGVPSDLTLLGYGDILDTNSAKYGNCTSGNCANYYSTSGSFVGAGSMQIYFTFFPDTSFVPAGLNEVTKVLSFNAYVKDSCSVDRINSIAVLVKVKKAGAIYGPSSMTSCYGSGVYPTIYGDTSNVSWSPTTGVSNPTSGSPWLNPPSTTVYTITHVPSGDAIQLTVNVDSIGPLSFNLINTGTELIVPAFANAQTHWIYNGALLTTVSDTLPLDVTGTYWAEVEGTLCKSYSDTVHALVSAKFSNSNTQGGPINTMASSSSFQFSLNQNGNTLESLELILPDTSAGKTTSLVVVELYESGNLIKSSVASQKTDWLWEAIGFNTLLSPGLLYEVKITTDLSSSVLFQPVSLPFTEDNGIVYIASGSYIENAVQVNGAYHYVNFEFSSAIGVVEETLVHKVYPNPAKTHIDVLIDGTGELSLYDVQGRKILSEQIDKSSTISIEHLEDGVYIYQINTNAGLATGTLIVQ